MQPLGHVASVHYRHRPRRPRAFYLRGGLAGPRTRLGGSSKEDDLSRRPDGLPIEPPMAGSCAQAVHLPSRVRPARAWERTRDRIGPGAERSQQMNGDEHEKEAVSERLRRAMNAHDLEGTPLLLQ